MIAVFDIGKTNKKLVVFDGGLRAVSVTTAQLDLTTDDDGAPCEDLDALTGWMRDALRDAQRQASAGAISAINFSTYGASLVHLGDEGRPVAPLYDYLKEYPPATLADFHTRHGDPQSFATETASPVWGMLNSGLQLFWLKRHRPDVFGRTKTSLHLPQYCSYVFSGNAHDEATSVGCHTAMWDFGRMRHHQWLADENLARLIPPMSDTRARFSSTTRDTFEVGAGVHDSSAALVPYLMANEEPFLFVSTGTWVVTMNPFSADLLTSDDMQRGALCYLTPDRRPVKSARLFLGNEFAVQSGRIEKHYGIDPGRCAAMAFDERHLRAARAAGVSYRATTELASGAPWADDPARATAWDVAAFGSAEVACHALNDALVAAQLEAIAVAQGSTRVRTIFVDGGFSQNEIFLTLLARAVAPVEVRITELAQASATGAALLVAPLRDRDALTDLLATTAVATD